MVTRRGSQDCVCLKHLRLLAENARPQEEVARLKAKLRRQERAAKEQPSGLSTPSPQRLVKPSLPEQTPDEVRRRRGGAPAGHAGHGWKPPCSWTEPQTGLAVGNNVEMIVYFIDGKVVGSHLKLHAPLSGQTFLTPDGVTHTFSGQPPLMRKSGDGTLIWDFHIDAGQYDYHRRLMTTLNAYRDHWAAKWKKSGEPEARPLH